MSKNLTTAVEQPEFAVITIDTMGNSTLHPVKSKAAATRKANSLSKDGAYESVAIIAPDLDPVDAEDPQDEVTVVKGSGKTAKAKKEPHQCACGTITVTVAEGTKLTPTQREFAIWENDEITLNTECTDVTKSRFTPGHDARYHGLERLAERAGGRVVYADEPAR